MSDLECVLQTLKIAIRHLERATVELNHVNVVQAARADLEKVVAALHGRSAVYIENISSLLRSVAKTLELINDPDVQAAMVDTSEAVIMLEDSIRDWLE